MAQKVAEFKDRLRQALDESEMKQIDLAERTGLTRSAINQYLSGYAMPKSDRIYTLAKVLGVTEAWLMGFDTTKYKSDLIINSKELGEVIIETNPSSNERIFIRQLLTNKDFIEFCGSYEWKNGCDMVSDFIRFYLGTHLG